MQATPRILVIALSLLLVGVVPAYAQGDDETGGRDPADEQEIYDRLALINPDAVPIFRHATQEMDSGRHAQARMGFQQVLDIAYGFPDAARRLSYVEIALGDYDAAVQHAQQAYQFDPSPYNHAALAYALLSTGTPENEAASLEDAQAHAAALPDDLFTQNVLALSATVNDDVELLRQSSEALIRLAPDQQASRYFAAVLAATQGRWIEAERELLRAQELGMPAADVEAALDSGIRAQARTQRLLQAGGVGLLGWIGGLGVLFGAGLILSSITLGEVARTRDTGQVTATAAERALRSIYRAVIAITSAYFYVSMPLLVLVVVGLVGVILYLFLAIGTVPIRLMGVVAFLALATLYAIVRSLFVKVKDEEPGRPLTAQEAPRLWLVAQEVAQRLHTRPIEAIYIEPGPEIGVTERGEALRRMRGAGRRTLLLGLGALPGMTQGQFKAILAHEYGHFAHQDTAGGRQAQRVKLSINQLAMRLAMAGQARPYNPAWLFVNGFYRIFLRITLGASRLQEILADRYAALAYGSEELISGLKHLMRQSLIFAMQVDHEIGDARATKRDLANLYALPPLDTGAGREELEIRLGKAMVRPTSPYDSHPAPKDRLDLLAAIPARTPSYAATDPAWDLLPDASALQGEMTAKIQWKVWLADGPSRAK